MREAKIEKYLKDRVEQHGGTCEKFVTPGTRGAQDRLVCWPQTSWMDNGAYRYRPATGHFIEVKRPKKLPTPQQTRNANKRRAMGFYVDFVNSHWMVDAYIQSVCNVRRIPHLDPPCPKKSEEYTG